MSENDRERRWDEEEDDNWEEPPRLGRRRRPRPRSPLDEPGMQYVLPVNTSGLAIAAGYFGLISVLCFPAPFALVLGILALRHLKRNPKLHGHGRAIFGIVMGSLCSLLLVFAMIAIAVRK